MNISGATRARLYSSAIVKT